LNYEDGVLVDCLQLRVFASSRWGFLWGGAKASLFPNETVFCRVFCQLHRELNMRSFFKGIALSLAWVIGLCVALPAHSYSIERLSLFIYDGASVYEDRRLTLPSSN
jgi:hypothetical protein